MPTYYVSHDTDDVVRVNSRHHSLQMLLSINQFLDYTRSYVSRWYHAFLRLTVLLMNIFRPGGGS